MDGPLLREVGGGKSASVAARTPPGRVSKPRSDMFPGSTAAALDSPEAASNMQEIPSACASSPPKVHRLRGGAKGSRLDARNDAAPEKATNGRSVALWMLQRERLARVVAVPRARGGGGAGVLRKEQRRRPGGSSACCRTNLVPNSRDRVAKRVRMRPVCWLGEPDSEVWSRKKEAGV